MSPDHFNNPQLIFTFEIIPVDAFVYVEEKHGSSTVRYGPMTHDEAIAFIHGQIAQYESIYNNLVQTQARGQLH